MTKKRILLVEDQPDSSNVLRAGLENLSADFEVLQAYSAEDGLRALDKGPIDLLVADVILPGISGLELLAHFRHYSPSSKIILISGSPDPQMRNEVARAGAEIFFFKPLDLGDFLDAVQRVLLMDQSDLPQGLQVHQEDLKKASQKGNQISKGISDLRKELNAISVLLVSERGQVMARSGALPDERIETNLIPDLMVSFFASLKVSTFMESEKPDNLLCYRGQEYHLHIVTLSPSYALLLATKPLDSKALSALAESARTAADLLGQLLSEFELPYDPSMDLFKYTKMPTDYDHIDEIDSDLDGLLHQAETKPMSHRKAEKYWKTATQEILVHPARGGALTFEQARRLGLTPPELS
jgi:DNA-binding response OmpR family regulator